MSPIGAPVGEFGNPTLSNGAGTPGPQGPGGATGATGPQGLSGPWGEAATATFVGSGSPVGVVTPNGIGDLYVDNTTPGLWQATGATSADWAEQGGTSVQGTPIVRAFPFAFDTPGLSVPVGFTPATVPADSAPTLPVTIVAATNDTFVFTGGGGGGSPETFTIAPGVYTTLAALAAAVAAATGSVSSEAFSTLVTVTHPSTVLVFTMVGDHGTGDNGNTLTEGDGGAAAIGITTPPDTFAGGASGTIPGASAYTPTIGDILLDAWIEIDTVWDGTTPTGEIGTFVGNASGLYDQFLQSALPMQFGAIGEFTGAGLATGPISLGQIAGGGISNELYEVPAIASTPNPAATFAFRGAYGGSGTIGKFTAANPVKVCVSQDGTNTGADPGSTQGAAILYLVTCTPV